MGADERRSLSSAWCICRLNCRQATTAGPSAGQRTLRREHRRAGHRDGSARKWHFQLVHHGIWDLRHSVRADPRWIIVVNGKPIKSRSRSRRSRAGSTCFDRTTTDSRCGRSKNGRLRRAMCPASGIRRRSRSSRSRRRSIVRVYIDRRSDRLHAGAAAPKRSRWPRATSSVALHAASGQQVGRPARHADAATATGARQLAGWFVRSRDKDL